MRVGGEWKDIDIRAVADGESYKIEGPNYSFIRLTPATSKSENIIKKARVGNRFGKRFGPLIDTNKLTADKVYWRINVSPGGVTRHANGDYTFDDIEGVDIGLNLRDWRRLFGNKLVVNGDVIELDFSELRANPDIGVVNLDPEVTLDDTGFECHTKQSVDTNFQDAWDAARAGDADPLPDDFRAMFWSIDANPTFVATLWRCIFKFPVAGYENATNVLFRVNSVFIPGSGPTFLSIGQCDDLDAFDQVTNWSKITAAFGVDGADAETLTGASPGGPFGYYWLSGDLVGPGLFDTGLTDGSTLYYGVAHQKDADNIVIVPTITEQEGDTLLEQAFLIITLPPAAGGGSTSSTKHYHRYY